MNCVELATRHARERPDEVALVMPAGNGFSLTTFGDLLRQAAAMQQLLSDRRVGPDQSVLVVDGLGPRLYATVIAILSVGATAILVEPWMAVRKIEHAIQMARPVAFVGSLPGKFWGARVRSIRRIQHWIPPANAAGRNSLSAFHVESVDPETTGILTFTSGTTGVPKGVVRSHGYLECQHDVLSRRLGLDKHPGSDLCIFANFVLANLASGRASVLVPPQWRARHLRRIDDLPPALRPETLTCGPGFLLQLMQHAEVSSLQSIHVGGALTDCDIFENGFERWPDAEWLSVYGSTEAEPVAVCDARAAVARSRQENKFQTLYLGTPVAEIESIIDHEGLWVSGPHVCPMYLGDVDENRTHKRRDANGRLWHFMGDRIRGASNTENNWWYAGRSSQLPGDFDMEQEAYMLLQSSKAFIHRRLSGEPVLVGENVNSVSLPGVERYAEARIVRDSRHRARIDRQKTLEKGAKWLLG